MATYEYVVDLTWNGPGSPGVSVWHFRADQLNISGSDADDCVTVISDFWAAIMLAGFMPAGSKAAGRNYCIDVVSREIVTVTPFLHQSSAAGTEFAGPLMMVLTLATSVATRSGRGRKFIGPVLDSLGSQDGTPDSGGVSTLQTIGAQLVTDSEALNEAAIGVYSRTGLLFRDLVSTRVRDTFAILRSRRD
jgi:hypothetical protein